MAAQETALGGGVLKAHLPLGTVVPPTPPDADALGLLARTTHLVERASGRLAIETLELGERAGADFRSRIMERERARSCAAPDVTLEANSDLRAPRGFEVVGFAPSSSCGEDGVPDVRLWVRAPNNDVVSIALVCATEGCLPDRRALLEAFVASLSPGTSTAAPAGTRVLAASPYNAVTLHVPEGFVVAESEGSDYTVYDVFRPQPMGDPGDGLSVSFLRSSSPNSLQTDYARRGARTRMFTGEVGGRRVRMLELVREGRTEIVARVTLASQQLDFQISSSTPDTLSELRTILAGAQLPEDDE